MRYAISLALTLGLLTACSAVPFNATQKTVAQLAPDVPAISMKIQKQAAAEMKAGKSPAENVILNACLITRDEARAEAGKSEK